MPTPAQTPWMAPLLMFAVFATFATIVGTRASRATISYMSRRLRWQAIIAGAAAIGSLSAAVLLSSHQGELKEMSVWALAGFIAAAIASAVAFVDCMTFFEHTWIRVTTSAGLACAGGSTLFAMAALTGPAPEVSGRAAITIGTHDAWMTVNFMVYASFELLAAALVGFLIKMSVRRHSDRKARLTTPQ